MPAPIPPVSFSLGAEAVIPPLQGADAPASASGEGFGSMLAQQLQNLNGVQAEADRQAQLVATGEAQDVTEAVVAAERAALALNFATQVRNRLVEAWREIERTQV